MILALENDWKQESTGQLNDITVHVENIGIACTTSGSRNIPMQQPSIFRQEVLVYWAYWAWVEISD